MEADLIVKANKKMKARYRRNPQIFMNQLREQKFNLRYSVLDHKRDYSALTDPHASYYFASPSVKDHLKKYRKAVRVEQANETHKKSLKKLLTMRINQKFSDHISPNTLAYEKELTNLQLETLNKKSTNSLHKRSKKSLSSNHSNQNLTSHGFAIKKRSLDATLSHQLNPSSTTQYPKIDKKDEEKEQKKEKVKKPKEHLVTPRISTHLRTHRMKEQSQSDKASQEQKGSGRTKTLQKDKSAQEQKANRLADDLHKKKHQKWIKFLQQKKQMLSKLRDIPSNPES